MSEADALAYGLGADQEMFVVEETGSIVVSTNERAVHLWESLGFEIVGRLPLAFQTSHVRLVGWAGDVSAAVRRIAVSMVCRTR